MAWTGGPRRRRLTDRSSTAWAGLQRRLRRLVPRPVQRADLALFRALAQVELPVIGAMLPPLSRAANHSRLWIVIAGVIGAVGGRPGRRAATRGLVAIGLSSAVTNLPVELLTGRTRPVLLPLAAAVATSRPPRPRSSRRRPRPVGTAPGSC